MIKPGDCRPQVWQLCGGPSSRTYADIFMKHGVGLLGPGDAGAWKPGRSDDDFGGPYVGRFAAEVRAGDIVLLRTAQARICAIGVAAEGEYQYRSQFDDVNGWDLQHCRRIRWRRLPEDHIFKSPVFGANPPRLSRVWNKHALAFATRFAQSPPKQWQSAPLPDLPAEEPDLDEIPQGLQGVIAEVRDLAPLLWDRKAFGEHPTEDELVGHFVIPFLRSLGWPPERISVKWRDIDVAAFDRLPRTPGNCRFIIEAKRLGAGVEGALEQARGYLEANGISADVVVTDGVRYRLYDAKSGFAAAAYANLSRLKKSAAGLFSRLARAQ